MKKFLSLAVALSLYLPCCAIDKVILVRHDEMSLIPEEIVFLTDLGLGVQMNADSVMMLDSPTLSSLKWIEPNNARSFISLKSGIYAAEGDSICRLATEESPRKFIGRLDNEQFMLYAATDSTLFACTADEDFSCVIEIDPVSETFIPVIGLNAPIQKISSNGDVSFIWVDDRILDMRHDDKLVCVYAADNITDMVLTNIGLMVATTDGIFWITAPGHGTKLVEGNIIGLWWDNNDALYYLTEECDLIVILGLMEEYNLITQPSQ
ncbi:MAG: hypothetical protein K2F58_01605 [Muribaculaceae bacterium]|nr:hypothetical protein [Muribaculaceae bacterium]